MNTNTTIKRTFMMIKGFGRDARGASMVEYIILIGIVALIAFGGFKYFGSKVTSKITDQGDSVEKVNAGLGQ